MSDDLSTTDIGPDTPLRLADAIRVAFPSGGMAPSGLRRERDRGRLVMERIAGKDFVTLRSINEMRALCRDQRNQSDSGSRPKSDLKTGSSSAKGPGSFVTGRAKSARAALEKTAKGVTELSQNTLPANTKSHESGAVIRLKSSS
jgi:hypothetical protein